MPDSAQFDTIEIERDGAIAWLILNRPKVLNALTPEMMGEVTRALRKPGG